MKVSQATSALQRLAPLHFAESWDNVGLLAGDASTALSGILLTIDCTAPVVEEAKRLGANLIASYHPPIFAPLACVTAPSVVYECIRHGIAIYSPHTALDVAEGGTNDVVADLLSMRDRAPLSQKETGDTHHKLVVFVPKSHVEALSASMFAAGAGHIGNYSACSFQVHGTGTFYGEAGANPQAGRAGQLERVEEVRLETVVELKHVERVLRAMRAAHPYEEPAFDLIRIASSSKPLGIGRVGTIQALPFATFVANLKSALRLPHVLVSGDPKKTIERVAVGVGAGDSIVDAARAAHADVLVTGELRHHNALRASANQLNTVCTLHSNCERLVLPSLAKQLEPLGVPIYISEADRDPFSFS